MNSGISKNSTQAPSPFLIYGALILIQVLFGLNYVVSKVILQAFPPLVWASFRIIIASIVMLSVSFLWRKKTRPEINFQILKPIKIF